MLKIVLEMVFAVVLVTTAGKGQALAAVLVTTDGMVKLWRLCW